MHRYEDMAFDRSDEALLRRARALAVALSAEGTAKLRVPKGLRARLEALLRTAAKADCAGEDEPLRLLNQAGPMLLAAAEDAEGPGLRLPGCDGVPRVVSLLDAIFRDGEDDVDEARLLAALHAFDEVQPLTMEELWAVPRAARLVLLRGALRAAEAVAEGLRDCARAEAWLERPAAKLAGRDAAFFAQALKLAEERSLPEAQAALERSLRLRGILPEEMLRRDRDVRAHLAMRLEHVAGALKRVSAMDWQARFEALSAVDSALREDPAGIYPRMDDASRAMARACVARLARALDLSELTLARYALRGARKAEIGGEDATVCWWLATDPGRRALLASMNLAGHRAPRVVPDPSGRRLAGALAGGAALICAGFCAVVRTPWLWGACLPAAWFACTALAGRVVPLLVKPQALPKLELDAVPDAWRTLVVMPALLSCPELVDGICDQLEALASLEADANIEYLLLGDFADGLSQCAPGDDAVVARARARVAEMNVRAGRERFACLLRPRTLLAPDGRWMGKDRKRGALMALNRVLLGEPGAEEAFAVENAACGRLKGRFALVVTLDADTRLLPGTVRALIGAMAHPLNRRCAVLQPAMAMAPSACANGFVRLFAGAGGVSSYPGSVSNLWQDVTGVGLYAGKGIYRVRAFQRAVDGALPEGRILSHDLIEGTLAGTGFLGDVTFYDGHPVSLDAALKRLHRWTRGDWQLLPLMLSAKAFPNGHRLSFAERLRLADNLLRSLRAPALLALVLAGPWAGNAGAFALGLALCLLEPLLDWGRRDELRWRRAAARLALLPTSALTMLDAALRTLWRLGVSGRHLMDWTTAADAEGQSGSARPFALAGALAALPGLMRPGWTAAALGLALLFGVGPGWVRGMERTETSSAPAPSVEDAGLFRELARATWRFFSDNVTPESPLPPDNVQLDPPAGAARRTSPTNIGLYLMSCLAACRLGLVGVPEMRARMAGALSAIEGMERWRGHVFNWIDLDGLCPLPPRYVSAVDSGNLAAALLLCAGAEESGEPLARRMRALAGEMDFTPLYDGERRLFHIGIAVDSGVPDRAHYDLLASESRVLSFVAMGLGQVSPRHWQALGRTCVPAAGGAALASWSGTMFEYLLPELFMPAPPHSLIGESVRRVVAAQIAHGRARRRPWGVSESGMYAFDARLNYQYQAFGLAALALNGSARDGVVAPYACALAAAVAPSGVAANLRRMRRLGWWREWGLIEAADYLRGDGPDSPALVQSHMAHHQGMVLCALCNALTGGSLARDFMDRPEARALSLLLEEAEPTRARRRRPVPGADGELRPARRPAAWIARPDRRLAETQRIAGAGASAVVTADGAVLYARDGVQATRFGGDLLDRRDPACVHLRDEVSGASCVVAGRARMEPGAARFRTELAGVEAEMDVCVSPEDGTLVRALTVRNTRRTAARVALADVVPVALAAAADMRAHAVFQDLFVESARIAPNALAFHRRARNAGEVYPVLVHMARGGEAEVETDRDRLVGRTGDTGAAGGISSDFSGTVGAVLNPVSALRVRLELAPGEVRRVDFALALLTDGAEIPSWLERWNGPTAAGRALSLARARASAALGFHGMDASEHQLLQRASALLTDGWLAAGARGGRRGEGSVAAEELWSLGLSGDRPVIALWAARAEQSAAARAALRFHGFYRDLGLEADLLLVDDGPEGYGQPVWEMLSAAVDGSCQRGLRGEPGGVWLIDGSRLSEGQRSALLRCAGLSLDAGRDLRAQLRDLLGALDAPAQPPRALDVGPSTLSPLDSENGYGAFLDDGSYAIDVLPGRVPPAPWCNLLAGRTGGALLTERGGGFLWHGNSRTGRLTPYGNDALKEGWGLMLWLKRAGSNARLRLLPGLRPQLPFRAVYDAASASYAFSAQRLAGGVRFSLGEGDALLIDAELEDLGMEEADWELVIAVNWLMGEDEADAARLNAWPEAGACLATGAMPGAGVLAAEDAGAAPCGGRAALLGRGGMPEPEDLPSAPGGWGLRVPLRLRRGERYRTRFLVGWAESAAAALALARRFRREGVGPARAAFEPRLAIETPEADLNALFNTWLPHQIAASRLLGRTGLYQPGGAYGFRDQLQDALALIPDAPDAVRAHLLRCAARQFEAGDVLHWWHEPLRGVRTRISDDALFLPFVTAAYVRQTGDAGVLEEVVPYLEDAPIPEGREDLYAEMRPGAASGTLREHCLRAFWKASAPGGHGLALMGTGDWNDGMNRVGAAGRGESVWLSQFLIACAEEFVRLLPEGDDARRLRALSNRLRVAVEANGWDGQWYLRAYDDEGMPLGSLSSGACRIDAISQAWAQLAGLDDERCGLALAAAWRHLADGELGIIRLLAPPFGEGDGDPGYIRGYPEGVRENGGQYTHAALWLLLAMIRRGDGERAHRALQMLLPFNHARSPEAVRRYRVEPYVMAADVYDSELQPGRGGWTWYTGAAAWMRLCLLALLGYEREGNRVRLSALLGPWPEAALVLKVGGAEYRLVCGRDVEIPEMDGAPLPDGWAVLLDDGCRHEARFPARDA